MEAHVVVVTTSQYSKGLFCTWAATRPEMWAMSILRDSKPPVSSLFLLLHPLATHMR